MVSSFPEILEFKSTARILQVRNGTASSSSGITSFRAIELRKIVEEVQDALWNLWRTLFVEVACLE